MWLKLLIFLLELHFITNKKPYFCTQEKCACCFAPLNGSRSNDNNDDPNDPTAFDFIPSKSRLFEVFLNWNYDDFNISGTKLKEIKTMQIRGFHKCSENNFEQFRKLNYYPISKNISFPNYVPTFKKNLSNFQGFQKCLVNYCQNETLRLTNMLICADNSIVDFHIDFVDQLCISNITYIHVISDKITSVGFDTFFFNSQINWNVVYLQLDVGDNSKIDLKCYSFKFLKSLRVITINNADIESYKCLFEYNPDLVKITSGIQRIWNLCDQISESWLQKKDQTAVTEVTRVSDVKDKNRARNRYKIIEQTTHRNDSSRNAQKNDSDDRISYICFSAILLLILLIALTLLKMSKH